MPFPAVLFSPRQFSAVRAHQSIEKVKVSLPWGQPCKCAARTVRAGGIADGKKRRPNASLAPSLDGLTLTTKKKKTNSSLNFTQAGGMEQVGSAYAAALVETAQAKGSLDAVHADVDTLQVRTGEERNFPLLLPLPPPPLAASESLTAARGIAGRGFRASSAFSPALLLVHWGLWQSRSCTRHDRFGKARGKACASR